MKNYTMTENMKLWLKDIYLREAENHRKTASNYHLWALGSHTDVHANMYEKFADEHREFARILETMANDINIDFSDMLFLSEEGDENIKNQDIRCTWKEPMEKEKIAEIIEMAAKVLGIK